MEVLQFLEKDEPRVVVVVVAELHFWHLSIKTVCLI